MATTSIWAVKVRMDTVIDYIENPEKTTKRPELEQEALAARRTIGDVINYAADEDKTDQMMYVTGINCHPDTALADFTIVKKRWHKEGGRLASHGYQSFLEGPGEISAEEAHEIGVQLAKELWGDRFQVVVATHLNTGHYHNHFVLNSVSYADGYKYVRFNSDYRKMQEVSDRLCREHGLHVITNPSTAKGKTYDEWSAEREGKYTIRGVIREDIDYAISMSWSWNGFTKMMSDLGYEFKFYKKDGTPLEHPGIKPYGAKGYFRFKNLGANYTEEAILQRIMKRSIVPPKITNFKEWNPPDVPMDGLPFIYRRYCFRLFSFVRKPPKRKEYISMALREDIRRLDHLIEQLDFMYQHKVYDKCSITVIKERSQKQIETLQAKKKQLYSKMKSYERSGRYDYASAIKQEIKDTSREIAEHRHKIKLCDECFITSDEIVKRAYGLEAALKKGKQRSRGAR